MQATAEARHTAEPEIGTHLRGIVSRSLITSIERDLRMDPDFVRAGGIRMLDEQVPSGHSVKSVSFPRRNGYLVVGLEHDRGNFRGLDITWYSDKDFKESGAVEEIRITHWEGFGGVLLGAFTTRAHPKTEPGLTSLLAGDGPHRNTSTTLDKINEFRGKYLE